MKYFQIIGVLVLGVLLTAEVYAQEKNITFQCTDKPLKEILNFLEEQHGIRFSYANDLKTLERKITTQVDDQSLDKFLQELFAGTDIEYRVISRHVALKKKATPGEQRRTRDKSREDRIYSPETNATDTVQHVTAVPEIESDKNTGQSQETNLEAAGTFVSIIDTLPKLSDEPDTIQRQHATIEEHAIISRKGKSRISSQLIKRGVPDVGVIASIDSYNFKTTSVEGEESSYLVKPNVSVGAYVRKGMSDKLSVEIQPRLATRNFQVRYNYRVTDPEDPFVVDKTSFRLLYVSVPVSLDYLLYKKAQLFVTGSLGAVIDLKLKETTETFLKSGDESIAPLMLGSVRQNSIGSFARIQARYAFRERMWMNFSPAYRYYFTPFSDGVMGIDMKMLTVEIGLLFGFR